MKYYIIAGEASGDLHGSNLIKGLRANDPEAEFRFWGGDLMVEASGSTTAATSATSAVQGGGLAKHYRENSIMGFLDVLKSLGRIARLMKFCKSDILAFAPDVVILIDYPGFNIRVAKFTKSQGIKTYYYIAPKVWAWREYRIRDLKRYVDRLFVIFPFEIDYFAGHGIKAYYAGNPLMDSISERATQIGSRQAYLSSNQLADRPIVALVAGSRSSEVKYNLPLMIEVARQMPDYQFVVTGVDWLDPALYDRLLQGSDVRIVYGQTYETMRHAAGALVTSGTATLEAALLGTHQVVCFKQNRLTLWVVSKMVKIRFVSLVNLILDYGAVRELLRGDCTADNAVRELTAILPGGALYDRMEEDYAALRHAVGAPGASGRIAIEVIRSLGK